MNNLEIPQADSVLRYHASLVTLDRSDNKKQKRQRRKNMMYVYVCVCVHKLRIHCIMVIQIRI